MRIIHFVCGNLAPGGYEYAVHHLANNLARAGHEVTLLCKTRRSRNALGIHETTPHEYRVREYYLPPTKGIGHGVFGKRAIQKAVAELRPDIIHCTMGWPTPVWALAAFPSAPPHLVAMFQGADIQINPEYGYGLRLDPAIDRDIRRVVRDIPNLLTISSVMKQELVNIGAPPKRVDVLPNGVDISLYRGPKPARTMDAPYIFGMGRFIRKKGYDLLLNAFAKAVKETNLPWQLCLAGAGPLLSELKTQAAVLGIGHRVQFLGYLTGQEKIAWLRNAEIFAHPARREAFGIVNAEALAAGLPIVGFAVDGLLDIVRNGENGILIAPYDVDNYASALMGLMSDSALRERMCDAALITSRRYDWQAITTQLIRYYNGILTGERIPMDAGATT